MSFTLIGYGSPTSARLASNSHGCPLRDQSREATPPPLTAATRSDPGSPWGSASKTYAGRAPSHSRLLDSTATAETVEPAVKPSSSGSKWCHCAVSQIARPPWPTAYRARPSGSASISSTDSRGKPRALVWRTDSSLCGSHRVKPPFRPAAHIQRPSKSNSVTSLAELYKSQARSRSPSGSRGTVRGKARATPVGVAGAAETVGAVPTGGAVASTSPVGVDPRGVQEGRASANTSHIFHLF